MKLLFSALAIMLVGAAAFPDPIEGTILPQPNLSAKILGCNYLHDDTVDVAVESTPMAVVRLRLFDSRGVWIADDLVDVRTFVIAPVVRRTSSPKVARIECSIDALLADGYEIPEGDDARGDLAPCDHRVTEETDDSGPTGSIQSISIGRGWLGVSFQASVAGFIPPSYGKLHHEPYALTIDGRTKQTLYADGLEDNLSFVTAVSDTAHVVKVIHPDYPDGGWAACLNRVAP